VEQNAGRQCTDREAAQYTGVGYNGPFTVELGSSQKYGLLERPVPGEVLVTDRARQALRPQNPGDDVEALRGAVQDAPSIGEVYAHYRGENLPDGTFFDNALTDKFGIPEDKIELFKSVFLESLRSAKLIEEVDGKAHIIDVSTPETLHKLVPHKPKIFNSTKAGSVDTCFVIMPFSDPVGSYYDHIYKPAIEKAGLKPVRADTEIFGTGKIIDQIWRGITESRVLVAELTGRNPNVFYELGLAHALKKPVVLVSADENDVPFDLRHIRVIIYKMSDPFWGQRLIEKVSENILSAIENPEEALFQRALSSID
jgi:hypothetical protein